MKRNILIAFFLAPLLICSNAFGTDLPDFPFLVSTGEANQEVAPDMATISVEFLAFSDSDADSAISVLSSAFEDALSILEKYEIPIEKISATDLQRSTTRARNSDYQYLDILGYEVSRTLTIELNDIVVYPALAEELASIENLRSIGASFDLSNRTVVEEALLTEAAKEARRKAGIMAESFGQEIESVYAISQASNFAQFFATFGARDYSRYPLLQDSSSPSSMTIFVPETIDLYQSVNAVFRIKEQ